MKLIIHAYNRRIVFHDEGKFEENKHPRANNGQFGSGGGGSSSHPAVAAKTKGSSAERVALRALLKDPKQKEHHGAIQDKILQSFAQHHAELIKKGDTAKAAEIAGKAADHAKKYGKSNPLSVKSASQANEGYSPKVQEQAQAVMKAELPKPASGQFTPQETADFNDLVALDESTESAKVWTAIAKKKVAQHNLNMSPGECAHIVAYSGHAYRKTNAELRAGVMDESTWKHVNQLNKALDKLPPHVGTVYRKATLKPEAVALYQPGKIVEERGFTSSSKEQGTWSGDVQFVLKSKSGRDISHISRHPGEAEVLFKSGTRFKIVSNSGNKITMEEVDGR